MSKIEQCIDEIETYIDRCKPQALNKKNIVVDRDEIMELLGELRHRTPDEIKKYQKIINNQEAILSNAQAQADAMLAEATKQTNEMINEHEIMQRAYAKASEIIDQANAQAQDIVNRAAAEANSVQDGAIRYTDDLLKNIQGIIGRTIENSTSKHNAMIGSLQSVYDVISANRQQLKPEEVLQPSEEKEPEEGEQ